MRVSRGPTLGLLSLLLLITPTIAQNNNNRPSTTEELPDLATITQTDQGDQTTEPTETSTGRSAARTTARESDNEDESSAESTGRNARPTPTLSSFRVTQISASETTSTTTEEESSETGSTTKSRSKFIHPSDLPTIAGVGIPSVKVPDTHAAPFMQKSNLPDGTVFICVGAALGAFGAAILLWRGMVAWALHRSVKRAAMAQNLADLKAMTANPLKKRPFYSAVGASSNMSLDRLSAAPTGTSKPLKPFASGPGGTPPKGHAAASLFYSPTGANAPHRDSIARPGSNYLPAGYYPTGAAQPGSNSPMTHAAHSSLSLAAPAANRFSTRSGISPPASPSLPPSRGPGGAYERAPPSRGNDSLYNRNSVATLGNGLGGGNGVYGPGAHSQSNLSLNVPGGTHVPGGRAPSAYLEDLFENHGNGPRERF